MLCATQLAPVAPQSPPEATITGHVVVTPDDDEEACILCRSLTDYKRNMRFRAGSIAPAWGQCDECDEWLHLICDGVFDPAALERLQDSDAPYICRRCAARKRSSPEPGATSALEPKRKKGRLGTAKDKRPCTPGCPGCRKGTAMITSHKPYPTSCMPSCERPCAPLRTWLRARYGSRSSFCFPCRHCPCGQEP
jgi:hypothetical protein